MKKILAAIISAAALLTLCACGAVSPDVTVLVGADSAGKGAAAQLLGELVSEKAGELSEGALIIDYHPNGELGGDIDLLRQAKSGDIAIVICQTAPVVSFVPEMAVFDLPMVFSKYDGETIDRVLNGEGEFRRALSAAYEKAGYQLLGIMQDAPTASPPQTGSSELLRISEDSRYAPWRIGTTWRSGQP